MDYKDHVKYLVTTRTSIAYLFNSMLDILPFCHLWQAAF